MHVCVLLSIVWLFYLAASWRNKVYIYILCLHQVRQAGAYIFCLSMCSSDCPFLRLLPNCYHNILKISQPILVQIGTVVRCQLWESWGPTSSLQEAVIGHKKSVSVDCLTNCNQTWYRRVQCIMVNANSVTTTRMQRWRSHDSKCWS